MTKTTLKEKIEKIFQDVENRGHYVGTDVYKISSLLSKEILKGMPKEIEEDEAMFKNDSDDKKLAKGYFIGFNDVLHEVKDYIHDLLK